MPFIMESLKEIKNFECSKCVNIQFTEDNIVSLNTGKGVHIVTLDSSSVSHQILKRQYLPASNHAPLKHLLSTQDNQVLWNFDFNSIKEAFCTAEAFGFFSKCPPRPFVVLSKLSPAHYGIRYLAAVTNHGALEVYQEINQEWTEVHDVMGNWLKESYSGMGKPCTWPEWESLLQLGKPSTFCWIQMQSHLLLLVALLNGDLAVFCKTDDDHFSMQLIKRIASSLSHPSTIHGFAQDHKITAVVGYINGKMAAYSFNPFSNKSAEPNYIWNVEDHLIPKDITSVEIENTIFLVTSKYNFLLIHSFSSTECVSTRTKDYGEVIKTVKVSGTNIYVAFDSGTMASISLPNGDVEREVRCPEDCHNTLEGICISRSGMLWVIASSITWTRGRVSFLTVAGANPSAALDQQLTRGETLKDNLDLLWLLKVSQLDASSPAATAQPQSQFKKLLYWELQLRLAGEGDENLEGALKVVETQLVDEYAAKLRSEGVDLEPFLSLTGTDFEFCLVCSSAVVSSDVRVIVCAKAHALPRCCITFKPCATAVYGTCTLCDAVALPEPEPGFPSLFEHSCPFCDGDFRISHGLC